MASGDTGNVVPGNRLRVRVPCPPHFFLTAVISSCCSTVYVNGQCLARATGAINASIAWSFDLGFTNFTGSASPPLLSGLRN
jgi:hypothetical protein